jgi:hypothetical protein
MKIGQIATAIAIIVIIAIFLLPKSNSSVNLKEKKTKKTRRETPMQREIRTGQRAGDYKWTKKGYPVQSSGARRVDLNNCRASSDYCTPKWEAVDCTNCNQYFMDEMTESECRKAANKFGGTKFKVGTWKNLPKHCVKRMGYPHYYWNKHSNPKYSNCTKNKNAVIDAHPDLSKRNKACVSGCSGKNTCRWNGSYYTCHNRNNNIIGSYAYYTCDRGKREISCNNHKDYACVIKDPPIKSSRNKGRV